MFWSIFLAVVVVLVVAGWWRSNRARRSLTGGRGAASGPSDPMQDNSRFFM